MTDPIWPTGPSYRPSRRRRGPTRQTRRLLLAAGVSVVLLTLLGGSLLRRPPGPVPVIEAVNRALRVLPDDRGGLQVPGPADQVAGDQADLPVVLAPPPEELAATALRAQAQALDELEPAAGPPDASSDAPAPGASRPAVKQQVTPVLALPLPRAAPAPPPGSRTGKVQLAAVGSQADARSEWRRLSRQAPDLLRGRTPLIERADIKGRAVWRLRLGGFAEMTDAIAFCDRLRSAALRCAPIQVR